MRGQRLAAASGAVLDAFKNPEQLAHPAHEQSLLVDLDPCARRRGEDHVVPRLDRHRNADVIPPVEPRADREHDAVLRGWLIRARGNEQSRPPYAVGIKLFDDDPVKQGAKLIAQSPLILGLEPDAPDSSAVGRGIDLAGGAPGQIVDGHVRETGS